MRCVVGPTITLGKHRNFAFCNSRVSCYNDEIFVSFAKSKKKILQIKNCLNILFTKKNKLINRKFDLNSH